MILEPSSFISIFFVTLVKLLVYNYLKHLVNLKNYPKGPIPIPIIGKLHLLSKKSHIDF